MKKLINYLASIIFFVLFTSFCLGQKLDATNTLESGVWQFHKISKNNVLYDGSLIDAESSIQYANTKIVLEGNILTVSNRCAVEYVKEKKTPLAYWMSQKTANLYSKLFEEEGIYLKNSFNVIMAVFPDQECSEPFVELIEQGDYLTAVTTQGYLLLFKKTQVSPFDINLYLGDHLISDKNVARAINETCAIADLYNRTDKQVDEDNKRCVLSNIEFAYGQLSMSDDVYAGSAFKLNEKVYVSKPSSLNVFIKNTKQEKSDIGFDTEFSLFTEKNNKIVDSVMIYKEQSSAESFSATTQYYYLDKELNLWVMQLLDTEEGTVLKHWKHYKINIDGKIKQLDSILCDYTTGSSKPCKET